MAYNKQKREARISTRTGMPRKKKAAKAQADSPPVVVESRYRQMIEEAADVAYTINALGFFTYVNPASEQLTGYSPQELIGAHFTILVAHGWRRRLIEFYVKQIETRERVTRIEFPIATKAGQIKWVEQIVTLAENNGEIEGFYSIVRDVTARREIEDALRRSEAENKALLQAIPDRIFIVKKDGSYIQYQGGDEMEAAFLSGQFSGQNARDQHLLTPEALREGARLMEKAQAEGSLQTFEFEANTPSGRRSFEGRLTALNGGDQALLIARDITERKRSQRDLEQRLLLLAVLQQVDIELNHTLDIHWVLLVALNAAMVLSNADAGSLALIEDHELRLVQVSGAFPQTNMPLDKGIIGRALRAQQGELVLDVNADPDYVEVLPGTCAEIAIPLLYHG
jgi:PAS domain S-box-containing protein